LSSLVRILIDVLGWRDCELTFIIASLTLELVIKPPLKRLSISSLLVFPEHRQAMSTLDFVTLLMERIILRRECSLAVVCCTCGGLFVS